MTVLKVGDPGATHVEVLVNGKPARGIFEVDTRTKTIKRFLLEPGTTRALVVDGELQSEQVYCDFKLHMVPDAPLSLDEVLRRADVQRVKEALTP